MKTIKEYKALRTAGYVGLTISIAILIMSSIFIVPVIFLNALCGLYSSSCIDIVGPLVSLTLSALGIAGSCVAIAVANNKIGELENQARAKKKEDS